MNDISVLAIGTEESLDNIDALLYTPKSQGRIGEITFNPYMHVNPEAAEDQQQRKWGFLAQDDVTEEELQQMVQTGKAEVVEIKIKPINHT